MILSLLLLAVQNPAPQPEAESKVDTVTRTQLENQVVEVANKFAEAAAKLTAVVSQFEMVSLDSTDQAVLKPAVLGDAVDASHRLIAEMDALLEMIPP